MRQKLSLEEATRLALTEELDDKNYVSGDGQTLYLDTLGQTLERTDSDSSLPTYEDETETLTAIVGTGKEVYDDMKSLTDQVDEYVENAGYTVDEFCKLGLIAFVYEEEYDSHEVIELDTIINTTESKKVVEESYTAREQLANLLAKFSAVEKDRIKVVVETKNYLLTVAKSVDDDGYRLMVVKGSEDEISVPDVFIDQDYEGKCLRAQINWAGMGSRSVEDTAKFITILQDAIDFCKQIDGKDFSKEAAE